MQNLANKAQQSVIFQHNLIEDIFNNKHSNDSLAAIEPMFDEAFNMVGISGNTATKSSVMTMFKQLQGTREGFKINIQDLETVWAEDEYVLVRYKEQQTYQNKTTLRVSTALVKVVDNKTIWCSLHETAIV